VAAHGRVASRDGWPGRQAAAMSNYVALILSLATPRRPSMAQLAGKKRFLQCPSEKPLGRVSLCTIFRHERSVRSTRIGSPLRIGSKPEAREKVGRDASKRSFRFVHSITGFYPAEHVNPLPRAPSRSFFTSPPPAQRDSPAIRVDGPAAAHATTLRGRSLTHVGQVSSAS
jgi:hypothetical protein